MVEVERRGGRLQRARGTGTPLQQRLTEQRIAQEQERLRRQQQSQALSREAQRLDQEFRNINFGGSIQEFDKQYNSIKEQNPDLANRLTVTPQTVRTELSKQRNALTNEISRLDRQIKSRKKSKDKAGVARFTAEKDIIGQALNINNQGQFQDLANVISISKKAGRTIEKTVKLERLPVKVKPPAQPAVTTIGQKASISLTDTRTGITTKSVQDINIEQQKRLAKKKLDISKITKTAQQVLNELQTEFGLKPKIVNAKTGEVLSEGRFNVDKTNLNKIVSLQNSLRKQQRKRFDDRGIGFLAKVYTPKQLTQLERSLNISLIPLVKPAKGTFGAAIKLPARKKLIADLEALRQEAIKGDKNAKAALIGIGAFPIAFADIAIDTVKGLVAVFKDPSLVLAAIALFAFSDVKAAGPGFGAKLSRGEPAAVANLAFLLTPLKIPKLNKFVSKFTQEANKIQSATTKFTFKQNVLKGSGTLEMVTNGINQANQTFKSVAKLSLQPKTKSLIGSIRTTIAGKTKVRQVNLKDAGAFFVDKSTGIKIPKSSKALDAVKGDLTLSKTKITGKESRITSNVSGNIKFGEKLEKKVRFVISPKVQAEFSVKTRNKFQEFMGSRKGKVFRDFRETEKTIEAIKSSAKKLPKNRTPAQWDRLNKFLEFVNFDKQIIQGFDRRTWMALLLNQNKKTTNQLIKSLQDDIVEGYFLKSGKVRASGSFETINPTKFRLGPSFALTEPKFFKTAKKTKEGFIKTPQDIKVPELNSFITVPTKLSKKVKIPLGLFDIAKRFGVARKYDFKNLTKQQKAIKLADKKIQKKVISQKKIKDVSQKKIFKTKKAGKPPKKPPKKPKPIAKKIPKVKAGKPPKKPPKKPKRFRLNLKKVRRSGGRQGYLIKIKKGNSILSLSTQLLPRNRALTEARLRVDGKKGSNPLAASFELVPAGKTDIIDFKKAGGSPKKFRKKKSPPGSKVLKQVEKSAFRRDTPKEITGLALTRRRKKSKAKAKPVKKKKSSNKKSKKIVKKSKKK